MDSKLLNVMEASKYVGLSRQVLSQDIKDGLLIPLKQSGNDKLFTRGELDRYKVKKNKGIEKPVVCSSINHKGGVGKSTILILLAYFLADEGYKVLFLDNDPQGNASSYFLYQKERRNKMSAVYLEEKIEPYMIDKSDNENIDVISTNPILAEKEHEVKAKRFSDMVLKRAFENSSDLLSTYQFILIDNKPDLGTFPFNAIVASNFVLVPQDAQAFAFESIEAIRSNIGFTTAKFLGIVLNKSRAISNKSKRATDAYKERYLELVFNTIIPLWDSFSLGDVQDSDYVKGPVPNYSKDEKVVQIVNSFGEEFLERVRKQI